MMNERLRLSFEPVAIFLAALVLRLVYLFLVVPTDPVHDSYHHWQIAYYSLHMGMPRGGRLWDLTGFEYLWGLVPTFLRIVLLWLLSTSSMLPFRIFNSTMGAFSAFVSYLILRRISGRFAARVGSLLITLAPPLVTNSTYGMDETIAIFFLLVAAHFYPKRLFFTGIALGLASMSRIEMNFVSLFVIAALGLRKKGRAEDYWTVLATMIGGWLLPMLPNFFYLRMMTGDPFYQIRYNVLGNVLGAFPWVFLPTTADPILPYVLGIIPLVLIFIARKLQKGVISGKARINFLYAFLAAVAIYPVLFYLVTGVSILGVRLFLPSIAFGCILAGKAIRDVPYPRIAAIILIVITGAASIMYSTYSLAMEIDNEFPEVVTGFKVADYIGERYDGGTIISNLTPVNYRLIHEWGIPYDKILGSIYAPRERANAIAWLKGKNATLIVVPQHFPADDANQLFPELLLGKSQYPFSLLHAEQASYAIVFIYAIHK